jgi:iron complex transport system permease protein
MNCGGRPYPVRLAILSLLLLLSVLLSLFIGSASLGWAAWVEAFTLSGRQPLAETIVWELRLPRVLTALLVGAGLAVSGAVLQNASRNPLADPYLFGLMSGAALGASVVSILLPEQHVTMALGAFAGAMLAIALVLAVSIGAGRQRIDITLLAGVAVSFMLSAISSFILYFAEPFAANKVMFWLMGSLSRSNWHSLLLIAPPVLLLLALALALRRQLDALLLADSSARSLGIRPQPLRLLLLISTALVCAVIVSQCGGIAFVGLLVPHMVRALFGVTAVPLLLGSALLGGVFMLWVDNLARSLLAQQEIPLGVITSVIGSIFFLMLLRRRV